MPSCASAGSCRLATMSDDIRTLSETLAADPSSVVFVQLGETLRRTGQLELAWRVAVRGLERHAQRADAHDLVARIAVDRGDHVRARAEWEAVLALSPGHSGALKGLGFLCFRRGELEEASRYLGAALATDPLDQAVAAALDTVRASHAEERPVEGPAGPGPGADARTLFHDVLGDAPQTAILLDADGYVVAGEYRTADGRDVGADIGAQLSGVSEEAHRAMRHLGLGLWRQIVFEAETASVAMAPSGGGVLLVAAPRSVPLGYVRRLLERSLDRVRRWAGGSA
jgi:predicted regulator of Ras-like GTPase activity (Roadblock/LC7/MglB family)